MRVTRRDEDLYLDVFRLRDPSALQLYRLHRRDIPTFATLHRRLGLARAHGFLTTKRLSLGGEAGAPPYRYSIGPNAIRLLADRLGLDEAAVRRRQRQDERLGELFAEHRSRLTDARIAFLLACRVKGYPLQWTADEEVAALRLTAEVEGKVLPVRPDAFVVIDRKEKKASAFFVEFQLRSNPVRFKDKAKAIMEFYASGAYTDVVSYRSLRVLAIADTSARAKHLQEAAEAVGGTSLFWSAALDEVVAAPLSAPVWWVGGRNERLASFADEEAQADEDANSHGRATAAPEAGNPRSLSRHGI